MTNVLIAGAGGGLGSEILNVFKSNGYTVTALAYNSREAENLKDKADKVIAADASNMEQVCGCCTNVDIVVSALGKSVSIFDSGEATFEETDYRANKNLIEDAVKCSVKLFCYISIYGSDKWSHLELAKVHKKVENELIQSSLKYKIIRPVGLFSGLLDILKMAKKGAVVTVGDGDHKTNPIHEKDLAELIFSKLNDEVNIIEAGGPKVYTRNEIGKLAAQAVDGAMHIHIPELAADAAIPALRIFDKNTFDKISFFNNVITQDVIAPSYGRRLLVDYFYDNADSI